MTTEAQNVYKLGQHAASGELPHLLGQVARFGDVNYASTSQVKPLLSMIPIYAVWCKNGSGGNIVKSTVYLWDKDTPLVGTAIKTKAGTLTFPAGVVDPYVTGNVGDGRYFWLVKRGPCNCISDGTTTIAAGDLVVPSGSATGKIRKFDTTVTSGDEPASIIGRAMVAITNVDGTVGRVLLDIRN